MESTDVSKVGEGNNNTKTESTTTSSSTPSEGHSSPDWNKLDIKLLSQGKIKFFTQTNFQKNDFLLCLKKSFNSGWHRKRNIVKAVGSLLCNAYANK